ncbi:MAG: tRNA lysidine(34) synthetase TilS [Gemmatimonadaceae bacterium]
MKPDSVNETVVSQGVGYREVQRAVAIGLTDYDKVVLAVSGGRDSMVMLDAAAAVASGRVAAVATFDHGTGPAARSAADLVAERSEELRLRFFRGSANQGLRGEAAWREERWKYLREVAATVHAAVATAHTRDDQMETVLIRVMRGSGARGLAGLYGSADVARPLLGVGRAVVASYAEWRCLRWVQDRSNQSRAHLRNRLRLDLIPALKAVKPDLGEELLDIARRAARLRSEVDKWIDDNVPIRYSGAELYVARGPLLGYDAECLALLWPAIVARAGVTLDRRGTCRLAEFTTSGRSGGRVQVSGGYEVVMHRAELRLRRLGTGYSARRRENRSAGGAGNEVYL